MYSFIHAINVVAKKSLKISKGKSESVNRRRIDNIMVKRKSTKGETINDLQNNAYKIKELKPGVHSGVPEGWEVPAPLLAPSCYSVIRP